MIQQARPSRPHAVHDAGPQAASGGSGVFGVVRRVVASLPARLGNRHLGSDDHWQIQGHGRHPDGGAGVGARLRSVQFEDEIR
jgi:hypothetical protein